MSSAMGPCQRTRRKVVPVVLALLVFAACKDRRGHPGDPCRPGEGATAAGECVDTTSVLACRAFTLRREACRGPEGCVAGHCDRSVAAVEDPCNDEGELVCSADGEELLRCVDSTIVRWQACRGDRGCHRDTAGSAPTCDVGTSEVGDACQASGARCGADGRTVVACGTTSHRYKLQAHCRGPKGCFAFSPYALAEQERSHSCSRGFVACDVSVGDVGEPCDGKPEWGRPCLPGDHCPLGVTRVAGTSSGGSFCSSDGKQELECDDGRLVATRSCSSCTVTWSRNEASYEVLCNPEGAGTGAQRERGPVHVFAPERS